MEDYRNQEEPSNPMEIHPNDSYVKLPITLDYRGGRSENRKTQKVISFVLSGLTVVGLGLYLFRSDSGFITKFFISILVITIVAYIIRFFLLNEQKLRNQYYKQLDSDYEMDISNIWGIYSFEGEEVKLARYRNGYIGAFVYFEKDVIVGREDDSEYLHHNAIQEAYKKAHEHGATIIDIDYMSFIGQDDRMNSLYYQASQSENSELKSFLNRLYAHIEEDSLDNISTFDVYGILVRGDEFRTKEIVLEVIDEFLRGNYVGYAILDERSIKPLVEDIFNLHDFSVLDAEKAAVSQGDKSIARAISITNADGFTKLNNTVAETRAEQKEKEQLIKKIKEDRQRRKKEERKQRRRNKKNTSKQEPTENTVGDNIIDL